MYSLRIARLILATALLAGLLGGGGVAYATTTYNDTVQGAEYYATSTQGRFAGYASGDLPGSWVAVVNHTPLSPNATITGGTFTLNGTTDASGTFTAGTVTQTAAGSGCRNQQYHLEGTLGNVVVGAATGGTGTFSGTLTHYRYPLFGRCVTYSATIGGQVSLTA